MPFPVVAALGLALQAAQMYMDQKNKQKAESQAAASKQQEKFDPMLSYSKSTDEKRQPTVPSDPAKVDMTFGDLLGNRDSGGLNASLSAALLAQENPSAGQQSFSLFGSGREQNRGLNDTFTLSTGTGAAQRDAALAELAKQSDSGSSWMDNANTYAGVGQQALSLYSAFQPRPQQMQLNNRAFNVPQESEEERRRRLGLGGYYAS